MDGREIKVLSKNTGKELMKIGTIVMMILTLSFILGGFLYCIILVWKKERNKDSIQDIFP